MDDLVIKICNGDRSGTAIEITAPKVHKAIEFRTDLTDEALDQLAMPLADLRGDLVSRRADPTTRNGRNLLNDARQEGYKAFTSLLSSGREASELVRTIYEAEGGHLTIRVAGVIAAGLPWELFMVRRPTDRASATREPELLGDNALIYRTFDYPDKSDPSRVVEGAPRIRALSHQKLRYAGAEIEQLENKYGGPPIVCHLAPIDNPDVCAGTGTICKFLCSQDDPYDVAHFACHNWPSSNAYYAFTVEIRNSFRSDRRNLYEVEAGFFLSPNCLAFLNCCYGAATSAGGPTSLVQFLLLRGCGTVLASSCKLHDETAALMSAHFYRHLFAGSSTTGSAFAKARKELWTERHLLSGYVYGLYGNPHLEIKAGRGQ